MTLQPVQPVPNGNGYGVQAIMLPQGPVFFPGMAPGYYPKKKCRRKKRKKKKKESDSESESESESEYYYVRVPEGQRQYSKLTFLTLNYNWLHLIYNIIVRIKLTLGL